ncbi:alpha/beta fold hydrolase [Henriciella aquimarina]|uniref:alpha/beta fold hydrolase n=1 Tax=Henriciella aquimarina TaxID=545261 RepID=UPI00146DF545|nr:alpha/beta hydrolase [Henriciella aquimarina]
MRILVHGVPDTPAMWGPLKATLGDLAAPVLTPALPGFSTDIPDGFSCTKDAYADWLVGYIETHRPENGQVDLVGHDWGALLVIRAAWLRPDLIRSWAVANALPDPDYKWHQTARIWQTPLLGELFMALTSQTRMATALAEAGMPEALAREEATHWTPDMRKAILRLYRSARHVSREWTQDLDRLPDRGLVFWGDDDPFVPVETAERFCRTTGAPLHRNANTGHWSVVERADAFARLLRDLWA